MKLKCILTLALAAMVLVVSGIGTAFADTHTYSGVDRSTVSGSSAVYTERITSGLSLHVNDYARWNNCFLNSKPESVTAEVASAPSDGSGDVFSTTYGSIAPYSVKNDFYVSHGPLRRSGSFSLGVVHWYYWGSGSYTNTGINGQSYTAS